MFSANSSTASNAYRSVGVESIASSATPHQLVLMLFNGARAAVAAARGHMQRGEIAAKGEAVSKALEIIDSGLKASLDLSVGGELAQNLSDLYVYMGERLFYANLKNDRSALDEVAELLEQLGSAWEAIGANPLTAAAVAPVAVAPVASAPPTNRVAAAYGVR
jgi:flagellar protein FliS